jgi:hypothetical protein
MAENADKIVNEDVLVIVDKAQKKAKLIQAIIKDEINLRHST